MKNTLRFFLTLASLCFCWSVFAAHTTRIPFKAVVVEVGIFQPFGGGVDSVASDTSAGRTTVLDEIRLIAPHRTLRAEQGVTFGFRYRLEGVPDGEVRDLEMRVIHPAMMGPDGLARTQSVAPTYEVGSNGSATGFLVYTLSEPFEVLSGRWVLQLLHQGRVVISQEFMLE